MTGNNDVGEDELRSYSALNKRPEDDVRVASLEAGVEAAKGTVWTREPYRVDEGGMRSEWDPLAN